MFEEQGLGTMSCWLPLNALVKLPLVCALLLFLLLLLLLLLLLPPLLLLLLVLLLRLLRLWVLLQSRVM